MTSSEIIRFEIAINAAAYKAVVAGLRGKGSDLSSPRASKRSIKASIELNLSSRSYLLSSLGYHKLPQAISVKLDSRTHNNISSIIASSLRKQQAKELLVSIQEIIGAAPTISSEQLEIFRTDLEFQDLEMDSREKRSIQTVDLLGDFAPMLLADLDETPTLIVTERPASLIESSTTTLRQEARLGEPLRALVEGNAVHIASSLTIPTLQELAIDVFIHWGGYEHTAPAWQDELIATLGPNSAGIFTVAHSIEVPHQGHYGATMFLRIHGSTESIWLGRLALDDVHFFISQDDSLISVESDARFREMREIATSRLSLGVSNPSALLEQIQAVKSYAPHLGLGAVFKEVVATVSDDSIKASFQEILEEPCCPVEVQSLFAAYGIGELVFATPESSHAAAGGLAQVISGLPPELCRAGVPVTIITPLYSYENGNKHPSAQELLQKGIQVGDKLVRPQYVGSVSVNLGPTYHSGTNYHCRAPSVLPIKVFLAQYGGLRVFLLSNASVFDRLYQPVYADKQLQRAIVLSRATLETIATSHFGIRPSAIISNDWMAACVPAFALLDPHYQRIPWLKAAKTIHMIHNGGADYHGRLPINLNNEDLWPLFNLDPEHFFGFKDPHDPSLLNLSMAATQHVSGALLTVSQPYASQISNLGCGDGLDYVLQHKRSSIFGISNGIKRADIDRYVSAITGISQEQLSSTQALLGVKAKTRERLQDRFGLAKRSDARLISFVGRMAEQKGLALCSGLVHGTNHSTLEDLLMRHEDTQILFAGPVTEGDIVLNDLRNALLYLAAKYPGRVATHFEYIPHSKALELILGSNFFLMPSRFEPGGITQLEALATGSLVIGRNVGGISATIENYKAEQMSGNGFLFNDFSPTALANTAHWALESIKNPDVYKMLVTNARLARHAWSDRIPSYLAMLQRVILGSQQFESLSWNVDHRFTLRTLSVE